jgi:deoxyribose-phosphate aldolase
MALQYLDVSKLLDHALLKPEASDGELEAGCALALQYDVASVCIVPHALERCAALLRGSSVEPSTTIGFPHGAHCTKTKLIEAEQALRSGATELDMVVNIGKVRSLDYAYVEREIAALLGLTRDAGRKLKVIFENCYLERSHKLELCKISSELRVDWIKTSTGVGPGGATREDIELMLAHRSPPVQVKASGGVRSLSQVLELRALGVSRIGTSSSQAILDEWRRQLAEPVPS